MADDAPDYAGFPELEFTREPQLFAVVGNHLRVTMPAFAPGERGQLTGYGLPPAMHRGDVRRNLQDIASSSGEANKSLELLKKAAETLVAAFAVDKLQEYINTWQEFSNQVRIAAGSEEDFVAAQRELAQIAVQTGASLESVGSFYERLTLSASQYGVTQQRRRLWTMRRGSS